MASYHEPYDYDDPRSRDPKATNHETPERSPIEPRSGTRYDTRDGREYRQSSQRLSYPSQLQLPDQDRYDSRYHYLPSSAKHASPTAYVPRSPSGKRNSRPPRPVCEDEMVSLRREAGSAKLLREIKKDTVPARGVIDQEVLIEYAPDWMNEHEKRFVLLSESERGAHGGIPTPPTSEDEKHRKARRRPSRVETNQNEQIPEMNKRTSSPYTFKPAKFSKETSFTSERFLSPDILTPQIQDQVNRQQRSNTASGLPSPRRDSSRLSSSFGKAYEYFPVPKRADEDNTTDDPAVDRHHRDSDRRRQKSPGQASEYPSASTSSRTFTAPTTRSSTVDARRTPVTARTAPDVSKPIVDKTRRPSPLMSTFALDDLAASKPALRRNTTASQEELSRRTPEGANQTSVSSRNVSPASSNTYRDGSPQRPTSYSSSRSNEKADKSSPTSKRGSADGSRPSSPSQKVSGDSPRLPRTDVDWSNLMAANTSRRGKPPSRLSTSMRQESMPEVPRSAFVMPSLPNTPTNVSSFNRPSSSAGLPYPENDDIVGSPTVFMPSEREYQGYGPFITGLSAPFSRESRTVGSREPLPGVATTTKPSRPALSQRHSDMYVSPGSERQTMSGSRQSTLISSQTRKELASLMKKGLPDCSRPEPVAGKDDWYTVIGAPELIICPECNDIFERTIFRPELRFAPPRDLSERVQCSMGSSKWIQLAWLLTLQLQRTNLALLKDLANIDATSDPCPGIRDGMRSWYGLQDSDRVFIEDFHVCYSDVRKLERLLPTLSGMFVRMPRRASSEPHRCALGNTKGNRFEAYLEGLITTHERALSSRKGADPGSLIDLVKRKNRLRECRRDLMFAGAFWHFAPILPTFTVCEDCFEHIVEPEIKNRSDIALRFNRTVQPVYGEGVGSSCQLYSPYMRQVFAKAIRNKDLEYLTIRSKRRREAELRLQARWREVDRKVQRLSREGSDVDDERYRLQKEVDRIAHEWKSDWE